MHTCELRKVYRADNLWLISMTLTLKEEGISCSSKKSPLMLGYSISIGRSQGIKLHKTIVNIGDDEFQIRLTYVPLSRIKTLDEHLLEPYSIFTAY